MSTIQVINAKHPSSASNNLVLDNAGNATFAGTAAMGSSFLRNRIINGGMQVWQRGTSFSSVGFGTYTADRWRSGANTTTFTQSGDVPAGFQWSISVAQPVADFATLSQRIEAVNCFDLAGQRVTVSFWAKSTAGSQPLIIQINRANAVDNFSATTFVESQQVSASPSSSWTFYSATFAVLPAQVANGIELLIYRTPASASTTLYTGVQLEVGSAATPFERRQYGQELALCQRYFQVFANFDIEGNASGGSLRAVSIPMTFPVQMRATPTRTVTTNGTYNNVRSSSNAFVGLGIQRLTSTQASASIEAAAAGLTQCFNQSETMSAEL